MNESIKRSSAVLRQERGRRFFFATVKGVGSHEWMIASHQTAKLTFDQLDYVAEAR